ncbi:hypothetical protein EI94DRAFT_121652 [Lactarius quietus]|nr:hypothetical protein EI94DRAFT_121652 [Lactarius quietus]
MVIGTIRATVATAYPSAGAVAADNNLRIASLTLGAYDYLMTLPAEYRIYKSSNRRSNVGFFHHGFKSNTCEHYFMLSPVFKVIQMMASQAILAIRTYGISQRSPYVGWTLMVTYLLVAGFQWFTSMYARVPYSIDVSAAVIVIALSVIEVRMTIPTTPHQGNCTILSSHPKSPISTWSFYMVAMLFDCLTLSISTFYLMRVRAATSNSSRLLKILLYDGLGYFVVLTLTNMANILLYRGIGSVIQTTG